MFNIDQFKIILLIIFTVNGQYDFPLRPEKCYGTDELLERKCCILPPFFDRDVARACGGMLSLIYINKEANVSVIRRETIRECQYWKCILDKYKLLNADKNLIEEKFFTHLEKWVTFNPDFSSIMLSAKLHCRQILKIYMPLTACEFFDMLTCIRNFITVDCPKIINSKECIEWKDFYEECREYFI